MPTDGVLFHAHAHRQVDPSPPSGVTLRHDWAQDEVRAIHDSPLLELVHRAHSLHRLGFPDGRVQLCSLLSVKSGGCSEDCSYCPQSARFDTGVQPERLLPVPQVLEEAKKARALGATRFCMGAAWREVKDGPQFEAVLEMVRGVRALGLEACCTLGMLSAEQARRLKEAGLTAYNHNLDTSPDFYGEIIRTHAYRERLETIAHARDAGIAVCAGGIIGMGESVLDRCRMLLALANQPAHPESVPINALVPIPGTPLEGRPKVEPLELVRMIATARILMPMSVVRLSAGRLALSEEAQLLCLLAGANSIFFGERLLTTGNPSYQADMALLEKAGLRPLEPEGLR
ncbi:MAG: biotin synthase BioB [Myxococcales bacterium]|nr:biotin synthase BioB [Myxococcales bacterium]